MELAAEEIFKFVGQIVTYAGGVAFAAFILFKYLGAQWIENKFSKKLEEYKGLQAKELEEVRSKVSLLLSRTLKLHDKEYVILPKIWSKLIDAEVSINRCIAGFREIPDLDRMSDDDLQYFLTNSNLSDSQKKIVVCKP